MPTRFDLTIDGDDVEVRLGTLNINETINGRGTLTCEVLAVDAPVRPAVGEELITDDTSTRVFGGNVVTPTEHVIDDQLIEEFATTVEAADFNAIADRITVINGGFPPGFTVKQALTSLAGYLAPYGVTVDPAQVNGPTLPLMVYDIKRVSSWFDEISVISGFVWEVDYNKVARFTEPGTIPAPWNVADDDGHTVGDIVVEPSDVNYANRVIVLAGTGQREVTEALTFNGSDDFVDLTYALVGHRGYLTVNGTDETLATEGTGFDLAATWLYDPDTNRITRVPGAPAAGSGSITYTAQFPYIAQADDVGAQAGPRGVVDQTVAKTDVFDATLAQALADGYLLRMVSEPRRIRYTTFTSGLHPGQTQTIQSSVRNINLTALITDVHAQDIDGETMRYEVTAVEGDVYPGSWRDMYRSWGGLGGGSSAAASAPITVVAAGGVGGIGTTGKFAKWVTPATLGDSILTESGSIVTIAGSLTLTGGITAGSGAVGIVNSAGKIPAISSTYFASLSAANLTSIPAGQLTGTITSSVQDNITRLGTIGVGVWNGTAVGAQYGGTGLNTSASSGIPSINGGTWTVNNVLNAGRVLYAAASNTVTSSADLTFGSNTLTVNHTITTPAATNLTLSPTGDLILNPAGDDILPTSNYDLNLGALNFKFLTLHAAELWVETLVAQNTIATIGGRVLVAPTNILSADLAAAGTTMTVKYNNFASGDRVYMEAAGKVEWFAVTSGAGGSAGAYTYSVTRNLDGSGANDWFAGDAVLNTGTTGKGFIDLYSTSGVLSGSGPTIVGNVRTGTTYSNIAARWAIGNLNGLYGYGWETYGAAFGDASTSNITIDATNGLRIRNSTTNLLQADITGALKIGNPSGNRLTYSVGSGLELVSDFLAINSNGVFSTTPSGGFSTTNGYSFTEPTGVDGESFGLYAWYTASTHRTLGLENRSDTVLRESRVSIVAANTGTSEANISLAAISSGSVASWTTSSVIHYGAAAHRFIPSSGGGSTAISMSGPLTFTTSTGTITERGRSTPMGEWQTPAYNSGHYTGSGSLVWTVQSGDVETLAYTLIGKTMIVSWRIIGTSTSGSASTELRIAIPGGFTAAKTMESSHEYSDNGTTGSGLVEVGAGGTNIILFKSAFATWSNSSTNNTYSIGQIAFEIQ